MVRETGSSFDSNPGGLQGGGTMSDKCLKPGCSEMVKVTPRQPHPHPRALRSARAAHRPTRKTRRQKKKKKDTRQTKRERKEREKERTTRWMGCFCVAVFAPVCTLTHAF